MNPNLPNPFYLTDEGTCSNCQKSDFKAHSFYLPEDTLTFEEVEVDAENQELIISDCSDQLQPSYELFCKNCEQVVETNDWSIIED